MISKYNITGMSCAACSARVEKAVSELSGVTSCSVNLLANSMTVEGELSPDTIIYAVEKAGYGASVADSLKLEAKSPITNEKSEVSKMKSRLVSSLIFMIALMYLSMGHTMCNFPLPEILASNPMSLAILQMLLAIIIMIINQKFFINGFKGLIKGAPNMDTLVAIGSGAAFVYSTGLVFKMTGGVIGGGENISHLLHGLYFESAAMILTLITVGKMLESNSKAKTTNAIKALMDLAPKTATVEREGIEYTIGADEIKVGDIMLVRPGESFAADAVVVDGVSSVDESALTGESIPVDKTVGDSVSTATINKHGFLKCRVTKTGEDTVLSKIIKLVIESSSGKAPVAKIADKVSLFFVPVVIGIAIVCFGVWLMAGETLGYALSRSISVLVISCPCALGLATPVAIMVGSGVGAKNGILFKTAQSLEETGKIDVCVFDKTGTITIGSPAVTDVVAAEGITSQMLLECAVSLEKKSEHPLSVAIKDYGQENGIHFFDITDFEVVPGKGLSGRLGDKSIRGGNMAYISSFVKVTDDLQTKAQSLSDEGKTPLYFVSDNKFLGFIAVSDTLKSDAEDAISKIKKMGIRTVLLTGDNERCAKAIGEVCGVDEIIADVAPHEKAEVIESLKKEGLVAMVGDGINDAPALTVADVGIAVGAGTDIAIDAADVVVAGGTVLDVVSAITLSRKTYKNIIENLFWAFIYNIIGIPLAAGVWAPILGWELSPMFGALAMSLSSVCVVTNALRLNLVKIKDNIKTKKEEEKEKMEKVFKIEGMMCPHCEARVKKVLEEIDGVESVIASHETGTATVTFLKEIPDDVIVGIITEQGYKVVE